MSFSKRFFKSFMEPEEEILMIVHTHILKVIKPLVYLSLTLIAPPTILWLLFPSAKLIWIAWIAIGLIKVKMLLLDWYFNALLVTNLNLIDVEWRGFFDRSAQRIEYNQIESFAYDIRGVWNTVLNIGDVTINKISGALITIEGIWRPKKRIKILTKFQDDIVQSQMQRDHSNLKDMLTNMLAEHIKENGIVVEEE